MAFVVTMPNGKKYKVGGASTPEQAYAYAAQTHATTEAPAKPPALDSLQFLPGISVGDARGIAQGAQQTWDNAAMALEHLTNRVAGTNFGSADRAADNNTQDAAAHPSSGLSRFAGNVGAGAAITAPVSAVRAPMAIAKYAPRLAATAAKGVQGALANLAIADPRNSNPGNTAALGAAANIILPPVVGAVLSRTAATAPAQWLGRKIGVIGDAPAIAPAQARALKLVKNAMVADNVTPGGAAANIQKAQTLGFPATLADQGENLARLAGSVTRHPGPARAQMATSLGERHAGQNDRIQAALERDLGPTANVEDASDALIAKARADAGPHYDNAFAGGSIAPLEHQFQQTFAESSQQVGDAAKALADAQRRATQAASRQPEAGNVYAASAANRGTRTAAGEIDAAQQKLAAAQAAHQANLDRLQRAQADGSANAPGAVWSPRIQQFLDDPIAKSGLAKGIEVQRLEALAEGKPFDPTEYAITGTDEAGNPIVASVPNMRTLDAVKRGLDEIINGYPKDIAGRAILDQRGRAVDQVRKAYLKQLDAINPDYATARAAFAGPMQMKEALTLGKSMYGKTAGQINRAKRNLSPSQLEQFNLGYRSQMAERTGRLVDNANRPAAILGAPERRNALNAVFGDNPNLPRFVDTLGQEAAGVKTHAIALRGSPTAVNAGDDALTGDQSIIGDVVRDGLRMARGGLPRNMLARGWENVADKWRIGTGDTGNNVREGIAALLSQVDPTDLQKALAVQPPPSPYRTGAGAGNKFGGKYPALPLASILPFLGN